MNEKRELFERIARVAGELGVPAVEESSAPSHPFDERNIHREIEKVSRKLFDDGHFAQATFEAFKLLDNRVKEISKINESGHTLMMTAFSENNPKIKLTPLVTESEKDEQMGFKFIFAGAMSAIRNPRGHDNIIHLTLTCTRWSPRL